MSEPKQLTKSGLYRVCWPSWTPGYSWKTGAMDKETAQRLADAANEESEYVHHWIEPAEVLTTARDIGVVKE